MADAAARHSRVAVVLGGGGVTGGWFELGVLRALDAALAPALTTDLDIFVGVSCGAIVGCHLAAGIPAHALMRGLYKPDAAVMPPFQRRHMLRPNIRELASRLAMAPKRVLDAAWLLASGAAPHSLSDTLVALGEVLPSGILDGAGLETYIRDNLNQTPCKDNFERLQRELYVVAVDVDTHHSVVFGDQEHRDVPISKAVRASASFPPAYAPTRIHGRDYVDGGVDKNYHLDVAIAAGAQLILCINPILPLLNDPQRQAVKLANGRAGGIVDKGMPGVLDQAVRMILHGRMVDDMEDTRRRYPDVDIVMLQPAADDYAMFFYNVGRFSARVNTARIGYLTAQATLRRQAPELAGALARHGLSLTTAVLEAEAAELLKRQRRKAVLELLAAPPGALDSSPTHNHM